MPPEIFTTQFVTSLLRGFFHLLYHQFAWVYDFIAWTVSLGMWQDWVSATLPYLSGHDILELGHGPGHLQVALMDNKHNAIGIDESQQMVRLTYRRLNKAGYEPRIMRSYSQLLPFKDESFHHIVSTFPTEYMYNPKTVSETFRVLAHGGTMVILPIAWITGNHFIARIMAWLFRITEQAPEWDELYLKTFIEAGFHTQAQKLEVRSSKVLIIIATKP